MSIVGITESPLRTRKLSAEDDSKVAQKDATLERSESKGTQDGDGSAKGKESKKRRKVNHGRIDSTPML